LLSSAALTQAEERVDEVMTDRLCFVVVKNGRIVHETYRRGHTESSLHLLRQLFQCKINQLFFLSLFVEKKSPY
jgi:hypothetical protein